MTFSMPYYGAHAMIGLSGKRRDFVPETCRQIPHTHQ